MLLLLELLSNRLTALNKEERRKLSDAKFCKEKFLTKGALRLGGEVLPAAVAEGLSDESVERIIDWTESALKESLKPLAILNVYVGYAWDKDKTPRQDARWGSIREELGKLAQSVENSFGGKVQIRIRRLRASHGEGIHQGVVRRIREADLLVFDIVSRETTKSSRKLRFNPNVVYELGFARGKSKKIIILLPKEVRVFADLEGYTFTQFNIGENGERDIVDKPGFSARVRGILADAAKKKLEAAEKERSSKA